MKNIIFMILVLGYKLPLMRTFIQILYTSGNHYLMKRLMVFHPAGGSLGVMFFTIEKV